MERKSCPNCGINDCVMRRVSGSTRIYIRLLPKIFSPFLCPQFFAEQHCARFYAIKMFSISLLIYPRIPAGASGIDIRQQGHLGRKKVFVNKISISINSVLKVSTVSSREYLVENLLLYCHDICISIDLLLATRSLVLDIEFL